MKKLGDFKVDILPDNINYDYESDSFLVAGYTRQLEYIINYIRIKEILGKNIHTYKIYFLK